MQRIPLLVYLDRNGKQIHIYRRGPLHRFFLFWYNQERIAAILRYSVIFSSVSIQLNRRKGVWYKRIIPAHMGLVIKSGKIIREEDEAKKEDLGYVDKFKPLLS